MQMNNRCFLNINDPTFLRNRIILLTFVLTLPWTISSNDTRELKHVHVIFAHKLYAPLDEATKYGIPKKLDYSYFLENANSMPNEAKMDMYNFGAYLRQRYDTFLGDVYYPNIMKMLTTEYFLSMISGNLVNAGFWPPAKSQKWSDDLDWQPILTEYETKENDGLFLGTKCPNFIDEENHLLANDEKIRKAVAAHASLFKHVSEESGKKIDRPSDIELLYSALETVASGEESNITLPAWAEGIFPDGEMWIVTLLSHKIHSTSEIQKQLNGGVFLKRILEETKTIIKTELTSSARPTIPVTNHTEKFKISLYSGEERNVIGTLQALDLWWSPHLLDNGAAIILELRQDQTSKEFGFEIYYYTGPAVNETMGLTLPGCASFCNIEDFTGILSNELKVLPINETALCHAKISTTTKKSSNADSPRFSPILIIPLGFTVVFFTIF